ncbi:DNA helicase, partial [Tanacetum coccineum]
MQRIVFKDRDKLDSVIVNPHKKKTTLNDREKDRLLPKLNDKQRHIYNLIMDACFHNNQELVFVYGHGGTGKTFLWKTIIYALRSEGKIVLAVASSDCDARRRLQTDAVKKGDEIIRSSIAKSYMWPHFKVQYLTENMRLNNEGLQERDRERVSAFAQWLLDIGNGKIGTPYEYDPENTSWVDIPDQCCIPDDENGISNLINFIYDNNTLHHPSAVKLQEKAIVCPKIETTDVINAKILSLLPGRTHTYASYDDAVPLGHDGGEVELLYPKEYLNTLSFAGLPPHKLELK